MHVISGDVRFVWVIRTTQKPFLFMKTEFKEKSFSGFLFRKQKFNWDIFSYKNQNLANILILIKSKS